MVSESAVGHTGSEVWREGCQTDISSTVLVTPRIPRFCCRGSVKNKTCPTVLKLGLESRVFSSFLYGEEAIFNDVSGGS